MHDVKECIILHINAHAPHKLFKFRRDKEYTEQLKRSFNCKGVCMYIKEKFEIDISEKRKYRSSH